MANKMAGEVQITLDGTDYTLRPSFAAIVEFEDRAGVSVVEALRAFGERQSAPYKAVAAAFHAGIKAGWKHHSRPPSFEEVGAAIYRDGLAAHVPSYLSFLSNAMTGEKAAESAKAMADQGKAQTQAT